MCLLIYIIGASDEKIDQIKKSYLGLELTKNSQVDVSLSLVTHPIVRQHPPFSDNGPRWKGNKETKFSIYYIVVILFPHCLFKYLNEYNC